MLSVAKRMSVGGFARAVCLISSIGLSAGWMHAQDQNPSHFGGGGGGGGAPPPPTENQPAGEPTNHKAL